MTTAAPNPSSGPDQTRAEARACARLTIDLGALQSNWRTLNDQAGSAECGAVIKADGYGLGADRVGPALWRAGARTFFVAHLEEGQKLRPHLPDAEIHILNGLMPGCETDYVDARLIPVLNSLIDVAAWKRFCEAAGTAYPCDLHIDTGMRRLGLDPRETRQLIDEPERLQGLKILNVLTHLACGDEQNHPLNKSQPHDFDAAFNAIRWPDQAAGKPRRSIANSAGVFMGPEVTAELCRPGVALYGVNPTPGRPNPMAQVIRLQAKILQIRVVDTPQTVGYGATHTVERGRIATLGVGYADGYLRSLSNRATAYIGEHRIPLVGRVSMDLITLDVSDLAEAECGPGTWVDLIGPHNPVDQIAEEAGTIGYEILTDLGKRYHRVYLGGDR